MHSLVAVGLGADLVRDVDAARGRKLDGVLGDDCGDRAGCGFQAAAGSAAVAGGAGGLEEALHAAAAPGVGHGVGSRQVLQARGKRSLHRPARHRRLAAHGGHGHEDG